MRHVTMVAVLGLTVVAWSCDKGDSEAEAQAPEGKQGYAHQEGAAHGGKEDHAHEGEEGHAHGGKKEHPHDDDKDHDHKGEEGHAHEGEEDHTHGDEEGHAHEGGEGHTHTDEQDHAHEGEEGHIHDEPNYAEKGTVNVPEEGKDFTPPVSIEQLPEGAWYCDMGKAPWAAMEKPQDGCPIEGSPLKRVSK